VVTENSAWSAAAEIAKVPFFEVGVISTEAVSFDEMKKVR